MVIELDQLILNYEHVDNDLNLKEIALDTCNVLLSNFLPLSAIFSDCPIPAFSCN